MAKDVLQDLPATNPLIETLILQKLESTKQVSIESGQRVKVWTRTLGTMDGTFSGRRGDILVMMDGIQELEISTAEIKKLRILADQPWLLLGGGVKLAGIGGLVFGGISLVAGGIALLEDNLGAVVLFAVPVLGGGGYLGYRLGKRMQGRTINLDDGWVIVVD